MHTDKIIIENARNIEKIIKKNCVNLSIIKPPYHNLEEKAEKHIDFIQEIMEKITTVTKNGGFCCMITSEDMTEKRMDATEIKALFHFIDNSKKGTKWDVLEKILWVKSAKKIVDEFSPIEEGKMISFDLTPFSIIWIMRKVEDHKAQEEFEILTAINNLKVSKTKKQEMSDSIWYIPQKSEQDYKDYLPKELILRLLMIFSKENDLVLDPFCGHGITAVTANILKRHFICIDKNRYNVLISNKRIQNCTK